VTEPAYLTATRAAYDTVAASYADVLRTELANKPFDRAMLATFAELVGTTGAVADLGCGPGRITAHLHTLGLTAFGIDLSPGMINIAREAHPHLCFDEGRLTDLDLTDNVLAGIVAWYSIIHTPPELLPAVFTEFHRVLAPGGHLLIAFQVGDETRHLDQGYGHTISLDAYRLPPDHIADLLSAAGLAPTARLVREPEATEKTPQAYLLARKPN
jgi:ubiquinone/menaquinone biosynthesis C-methylase UbiE